MKKALFILARPAFAAIVLLVLLSCKYENKRVSESGKIVTESRNITEDFTGVSVSGGLDVTIEQSTSKEVSVEADDNFQKYITTKVTNGILEISTESGLFDNVTARRITVKMPIITIIESSSASSLSSVGVLKGTEVKVSSSSGSTIDLSLEYDNIISEASSGSSIDLKGKALTMTVSASSGSDIDAAKLVVNEVQAQASSGSSIDVQAVLTLNGQSSSGGSIDYFGKPKKVTRQESSGGSISAR